MQKNKIIIDRPQLRDVINEILRLKKQEGWNQTVLGEKIGMNQSMVSKMRYGPDWETHWKVFWRLLAICEDLGIDPARELKAPTDEEVLNEIERHGTKTRGNVREKKKGHAASAHSPVSARGIKVH